MGSLHETLNFYTKKDTFILYYWLMFGWSNCVLQPLHIYKDWVERITQEFFLQVRHAAA